MGLGEEEGIVIRKEKKSKKKKKSDNENCSFDEEEVKGVELEDLKEDDDKKKKKKREKKKNKGSDSALQKVNGFGEELVGEVEHKRKRKSESDKRVEKQANDSELGVLKKEKKRKKDKGSSNVVCEDSNRKIIVEGEMNSESISLSKDDKKSDNEIEREVKKEKKKRKKDKSSSDVVCEDSNRHIIVEGEMNSESITLSKDDKKSDNEIEREVKKGKKKRKKDKGSSDVVCDDSNRNIIVEEDMNRESISLDKDEKKSDNEIERKVKKEKKKQKKEKNYESKEGVISSLSETHNNKELKETRESEFESIGEEEIRGEVREESTLPGEKKETNKKRIKHPNIVNDEGGEKAHDEEGSGVDVEYCKTRKKDKGLKIDTQDCSREILDIPVVEKEDCNKGHSGSVGKKKRDREKVDTQKVDDSKKAKSVKDVEEENINEGESLTKNKEDVIDCSGNPEPKKPSKRVKFSGTDEVFPSSDLGLDSGKKSLVSRKGKTILGETVVDRDNKDLNHGKRFTNEEDCILQSAVLDYIKVHDLGDNGLEKVLHCAKFKETKTCWNEIADCMPWRSKLSIYSRAHILFERAAERVWTPEEKELLRKFYEEHGSDWRKFADAYGKSRIHTKDTWRRIRLKNHRTGPWSQEEYQKLFDLVNMDLQMKVHGEKRTKHGMLRDDIAWEAISDRLSTRTMADCCAKWYNQLESPLIKEEKWASTDDIRLLDALQDRDFSSEEEVDWDSLLDHRSGDLCQKRWRQMVRHLGMHGLREFAWQVETLANRYRSDVLQAREIYEKKTPVD